MTVLPLRSLREEDMPLVGRNLFNLAKLSHLAFPVPEGLVVVPPTIKLQTILEHYEFKDKEVFEQKLIILKKEIQKIDPPHELIEALVRTKIDIQELWS